MLIEYLGSMFFTSPTLALGESAPTMSSIAIAKITETDTIKKGDFTIIIHKTEVCMLIVYLGYLHDCQFFTSPILAICESAPTFSTASIMTEADNIK